jgi:ribose 5-phosphate isomerase B
MRVHLGSDHAGVEMRQAFAAILREWNHELASEVGPESPQDAVDYPDIAVLVCDRVTGDPGAVGVLVCGTGQGMAMTANKIANIRAAVVLDAFSARMVREHNDANVLCIGSRVAGSELAKLLLHTFLAAEFAGGRHGRRVAKIDAAGG